MTRAKYAFAALALFNIPGTSAQAAGLISCSMAAAMVEARGYEIMSRTCGGRTHTFSTVKDEAVLIKVNAWTGRMKKIYGGD
jgi:hypothetical protein